MTTQAINPYPQIGSSHTDGLDAIITTLPGSPTFDDLNTALVNFINTKFSYSGNELGQLELDSILPSAFNAFINNDISISSPEQGLFIDLLINKIKSIPPLEIHNYILEIEENIRKSGLDLKEQISLYFATSVGKSNCLYWIDKIADPEDWSTYFNSDAAVNIANIPFWVSATIQATFYFTFKGNYTSNQTVPPEIAGPDYVTALVASIGVAAGKVIFTWTPKINLKFLELKLVNNGVSFDRPVNACGCHVNTVIVCDGLIVAPCGCIAVIKPLNLNIDKQNLKE